MKDWQHGYELDYLKSIEKDFEDYNQYTLSPFAKYKKNNIAESLHKKNLYLLDDARIEVVEAKTSSVITMYGGTTLAYKRKGDITLGKLSGNIATLEQKISEYRNRDCWLYVWAEHNSHIQLAQRAGFAEVGPKITSYGEIYKIYYRGEARQFPEVDPAEYIGITKVDDVDMSLIELIRRKLDALPEFTNHYSNYNKGKSWSALSLRGYTEDPSFITKPEEMSKAWKKENEGIDFSLQDTVLYDAFPEVRSLIKPFGDDVHRIRFMLLKPKTGELSRHTDQVDPDSGGSLGKLARLHFPIVTNDNVVFTVWDTDGVEQNVQMKPGECWFLDTRKPHKAVNFGDEDRIHLVVDVITQENLYGKLIR